MAMEDGHDSHRVVAQMTSNPWIKSWTTILLLVAGLLALLLSRNKSVAFFARYFGFFFSYIIFGLLFTPILMLKPGSPDNVWYLTKYAEYCVFPICRYRVKRKGCEYPEGPFVLVCNHQTSMDTPLMTHKDVWPGNCVVIMKEAMKYTGPFGLALKLGGSLFIKRSNSASAKETLRTAVDAILANKYRVWVFPEGTRRLMQKKVPESLLPFKKGAFNLAVLAQVPIVPLLLSSQDKFFNYKERRFDPGEITATVLPAIPTTGLTLDDVPTLSDEVRSKMMDTFVNISENCTNGHAKSS